MIASTYPNVYNGTLLDEIIHEQKLSAELVKRAAREVFAIIKEGLLRDGVVRINHFGSFKLKRVASRKGRNPKTGEVITIPGRAKVIFTPCKALREMIEPVHAKPIPVSTPIVDTLQAKEPKRESLQPVPELIPEPALLKTESESSIAIERVTDLQDEDPERRKRGGHEKLIYLGIAVTIIAILAIKSMPRKVETLSQPVTTPLASESTIVEPRVVTELEMEPAELIPVVEAEIASADITSAEVTESAVVEVEAEAESELAQIIASQSAQPALQRVELEETREQTEPLSPVAGATETDASVTEILPIAETGDAVNVVSIAPPTVLVVSQPEPVEQMPVAESEIFFTERPYKLQSGNSFWRLSKHFYTEPLYWPHIFYVNSDTITNPDKLLTGRTIIMPTLEGRPGTLTKKDREGIAEGYFLTYLFYKESGHSDAFFALLEAKRYSAEVVERKRHTLALTAIESILLDQQEVVAHL